MAGEVIKHGDLKCIRSEGMPIHRAPLEKGVMIIQFLVSVPWLSGDGPPDHPPPRQKARKAHSLCALSPRQVVFPEKQWLSQEKLPQLEALLPPRQKVRITDDMDQVELKEFNPNEQSWRQHREAYEEDDEGPRAGVQCQTA